MALSDNPHVKLTPVMIDKDGKTVLVIQTDLVIDANDKGYDKTAMDSVIKDGNDHMASNSAVDRVQIEGIS